MSISKTIILGRLGSDPTLEYAPTGMAICSFSVATSESWVDKEGNKHERVEWHRCKSFRKQAEHCNQYLKKGSQVFIEGQNQTTNWEKDGHKFYKTEIMVREIQFMGGVSDSN